MEELIIDNRERKIIDIINNKINKNEQINKINDIIISMKSMTVGDFAYIKDSKVIFIIERKTWKDLASTITGNRYKNVEKILSVDCKHIYFIEGKFNPNRNLHVGNKKSLSYSSMVTHLDHLMFNDNIHIIHTINENDTIDRIFELIKNYNSIHKKNIIRENFAKLNPILEENRKNNCNKLNNIENENNNQNENGNENQNENGNENNNENQNENGNEAENKDNIENEENNKNKVSDLFVKFKKNDVYILNEMINTISGISSVFSNILSNNINFIDILRNNFTIEEIAIIRYPSGMMFGKNKALKVKNYMNDIPFNRKNQIKILSCIQGISNNIAETILNKFSYQYLVNKKDNYEEFINTKFEKYVDIKENNTENNTEIITEEMFIDSFLNNKNIKKQKIKEIKYVKILTKIFELFQY